MTGPRLRRSDRLLLFAAVLVAAAALTWLGSLGHGVAGPAVTSTRVDQPPVSETPFLNVDPTTEPTTLPNHVPSAHTRSRHGESGSPAGMTEPALSSGYDASTAQPTFGEQVPR
jgi:hypothetical protein